MEKRLSIFGVGPKLWLFSMPYLVVAVAVLVIYPDFLRMNFLSFKVAIIIGAIIALAGWILYFAGLRTLLKQFKKGKLIQSGAFAWCRNPIYSSFILFFVPSIAFLARSWLILFGSVVLYIVFKVLIRKENEYLERTFGDEYRRYAAKVNEIIPCPRFWKGSKTL